MKRRSFIKKTFGAAVAPIILGGIPLNVIANQFSNLMAFSQNNKVVVMVQLAGGNDGLNTLIPLEQYATYLDYRANIAVPSTGDRKYILLDENVPADEQLGLHPDMEAFKNMYDDNLVHIVQNVGYDEMNMSHFRGRDIFFMGGGTSDHYASGWMGRYLNETYQGYPEAYPNEDMPDPLGIEFGYAQSLAFQREEGIPAGLAIADPDTFYQLVTNTGVEPPTWLPDSYAGDEMQFLMDLELKSNQYAERIKAVYDSGENAASVTYPETYPHEVIPAYRNNNLSWQLKNVARLISGGSKTKLFIVKLDGFDTHAEQVIEDNPTMGVHAALLYHLNTSIKAFYDDLNAQGLQNRVLTFTTSEFGRRVNSNDSHGTDHGKAAPMFFFGPMLKAGISGHVPNLSDLNDGNLRVEYDYRQALTSVLKDWLETPDEIISEVYWEDFIDSRLDLFQSSSSIEEHGQVAGLNRLAAYPNPAITNTTVEIELNNSIHLELAIYDLHGRKLKHIFSGEKATGNHQFSFDVRSFSKGMYLIRLQSGGKSLSYKLAVG